MIPQNEMRINNYFQHDGIILECTGINHRIVVKEWLYYGWHEKSKERFWINFFDAEPITIIEEWLLKSGFEWSIYHQAYSKKDFVYILKQYEDGWRFEIFRTSHFVGQKINFVHQLQNIYIALTGKELEIK